MSFFYDFLYNFDKLINDPEVFNLLVNNRFILILLVIVLLHLKYKTYSSMWASALVNIPGTLLHEFMHFGVGLVLNAQPSNFCFFPKKNSDGGYVMGSVGFRNITFYNAIPSALAPLLLLIVGFYLNRYWLPRINMTTLKYIGYVLLQTIIIENAMPSSTDFKVAGKYLSGIVLYFWVFLFLIVLF